MRKIRRMVSVVMISCMMAGCLAGCGSWKETGGTHGERQGTESRSGTERESIAERYRQKAGNLLLTVCIFLLSHRFVT